MLFYSLKKLLNKSGRSSIRLIEAFKAHASTNIPKNRFDPLYKYIYSDFSGTSFMINPHELLNYSFKYTPKEVAQYIGLASFRNFGDYSVTNDASLDLFHSPMDEATINKNRLLKIDNNRVRFYYEEVPKRRNKIWH